mmetsp:Transcript_7250/g.16854  ORF Transcript_7250/g.16854 Transcript_7250/m.16854 type:complete len:271 (-) Transcript_7250:998-1810(-)
MVENRSSGEVPPLCGGCQAAAARRAVYAAPVLLAVLREGQHVLVAIVALAADRALLVSGSIVLVHLGDRREPTVLLLPPGVFHGREVDPLWRDRDAPTRLLTPMLWTRRSLRRLDGRPPTLCVENVPVVVIGVEAVDVRVAHDVAGLVVVLVELVPLLLLVLLIVPSRRGRRLIRRDETELDPLGDLLLAEHGEAHRVAPVDVLVPVRRAAVYDLHLLEVDEDAARHGVAALVVVLRRGEDGENPRALGHGHALGMGLVRPHDVGETLLS